MWFFSRLESLIGALKEEVAELRKDVQHMAVSEATFDADLTGFVTLFGNLLSAYAAALASAKSQAPEIDLTQEDATIAQLSAQATTALDSISPAATTAPGTTAPVTDVVKAQLAGTA
jgi:hypothetical protein